MRDLAFAALGVLALTAIAATRPRPAAEHEYREVDIAGSQIERLPEGSWWEGDRAHARIGFVPNEERVA